jgi:hypothetical protein
LDETRQDDRQIRRLEEGPGEEEVQGHPSGEEGGLMLGRRRLAVPKADTQTVATLLRAYAQRTALRGGNQYRAKAYSRAADSLAALAVPLDMLIAEDRLTEIPGAGEAVADIITKLHRTGTHPSLGHEKRAGLALRPALITRYLPVCKALSTDADQARNGRDVHDEVQSPRVA